MTDRVLPDTADLDQIFEEKYVKEDGSMGPVPALRRRYSYFTPDDYYEALVGNLIFDGADWADVGCGRDIFPSNAKLARRLVDRCQTVYGIDPDPNIHDNPFITDAFAGPIEEYESSKQFDLVTLRMVAEHIVDPDATLSKLAEITKPGGFVVIYTPQKWAIVSIVTRATPMAMHHAVKSRLWKTEERDTFPVQYKMNTRRQLRQFAERCGFQEYLFQSIDDCRIFNHYPVLNSAELRFRWLCKAIRVPYPEQCIIAVYRRT